MLVQISFNLYINISKHMKTLILLSMLCIFALSSYSQQQHDSKSIPMKSNGISFAQPDKDDVNFFLWQDFDSGLMPPANWSIISGTTPQTWQLGTVSVFQPFSGDYFALCRYDETYVPQGQDERLLTPVMSFSGLNDAKLSFWFLFSKYWGIKPYNNYDLQVLVSIDGGLTFQDTIWTELSTDTSAWSSWQWVRGDADLTPYTGQTSVQLCFRYVGYDGADAAIDNVEITFITGMNELQTRQLILYPNPAKEIVFLNSNAGQTVEVYDLTGRRVLSQNINEHSLPSIYLGNLQSGHYSVVIYDSIRQKLQSGKLVIE